jgi:hypothetical protein
MSQFWYDFFQKISLVNYFSIFRITIDISRPGFKGCLPSRPKKGGEKT